MIERAGIYGLMAINFSSSPPTEVTVDETTPPSNEQVNPTDEELKLKSSVAAPDMKVIKPVVGERVYRQHEDG